MTTSSPARAVETSNAPPSIGHRSQAVLAGGLLFTGGQIGAPLHPPDGEERRPLGSLAQQVQVCLEHLDAVTIAAGSSRQRVAELSAFVVGPDRSSEVRSVASRFLGVDPPLFNYETVEDLALHGLVELDWIACVADDVEPEGAAALLRPLGDADTGTEVVPSGPFLITNAVTGDGPDLGTATHDVFAKVAKRLAGAGAGLEDIVKMTVFIADYVSYQQFNGATRELLKGQPLPTRSVTTARRLTGDAWVRVDVLAQA